MRVREQVMHPGSQRVGEDAKRKRSFQVGGACEQVTVEVASMGEGNSGQGAGRQRKVVAGQQEVGRAGLAG